jgi:predicted metal-dependent phosphotriesterase family hydrolase
MTFIRTVTGDIAPEALGATYAHDHLIFRPPAPHCDNDPDMLLPSLGSAMIELRRFADAGGQSMVEMTTRVVGRSPRELMRLSESAGVNIIAATGYHQAKFSEIHTAHRSVDELRDEMIQEVTTGMDDTDIKAGVLKAASSLNAFTPGEEKVFAAVIGAHHATGAPISTHTEAGTCALEQIERFVKGGVQPAHVTIGHLDRKLDWGYLRDVAQAGVFMSFDQFSKEKYCPDARRIEMIQSLFANGHGGQVVLGGDMARMSYHPSYGFGKGPGYTFILWRIAPWMLEMGLSKDDVRAMLVHNPARALGFNS